MTLDLFCQEVFSWRLVASVPRLRLLLSLSPCPLQLLWALLLTSGRPHQTQASRVTLSLTFNSVFSHFLSRPNPSLVSSGPTWGPQCKSSPLHVNKCKLNHLVFLCLLFTQNGNPDRDKPPCNSLELEDCDGFPEDSFSLTHFDGESLKPTQVVSNTSLLHQ